MQELRDGNIDRETAQEILKIWREAGVTDDPDELRKLYTERGPASFGRLALQLVLYGGFTYAVCCFYMLDTLTGRFVFNPSCVFVSCCSCQNQGQPRTLYRPSYDSWRPCTCDRQYAHLLRIQSAHGTSLVEMWYIGASIRGTGAQVHAKSMAQMQLQQQALGTFSTCAGARRQRCASTITQIAIKAAHCSVNHRGSS